jgi:hypothetical protein
LTQSMRSKGPALRGTGGSLGWARPECLSNRSAPPQIKVMSAMHARHKLSVDD